MEDVDFSPSSWLSTRKVVLLCMLVLVALSIVGLWDRVIAPSVSVIEDEILGAVAPSFSVRPTATVQPVQVTGMATTESSAAAVEAQIQATVEALVSTPTPVPTMEALAQVATSTPVPAVAVPTAQPVRQLSGSPSVSTVTSTPTPTVDTPAPTPAPPTPESAERFRLSDYKNGLWLRQGHPRLASSITELEWVRDGVNDTESKAIQDLLYIAVVSLPVASSIVALGWVQDGIDDVEAAAIDWMNNIGDAGVASSVVSLSWVLDGVDDLEVEAIQQLSYVAYSSARVASSIVAFGWVQDGIDDVEAAAIDWMNNIGDAGVASSVVSLSWVLDGVDDLEVEAIQQLSYVAYSSARVASSIVAFGWVQDGIDDVEAAAIDWMNNIGDAGVVSSVVSLSWVLDGVDDLEVEAIQQLSYVAYSSARVASSIVAFGWVQDGIDDVEVEVIQEMSHLSNRNPGAALRMVGMPFAEAIEPLDVSAIESLSLLADFEPEAFVSVMAHPELVGGITDDLAPVVATLHGVAKTNPGLIDVLLDPSKASLERRDITLPLAGDVALVIIRTKPGAPRSMDLLESSVRGAEEYMGLPLPTKFVGLLYGEAVPGSAAGTNFGTHVAIRPKYDVDDGSHEAESAGNNIAHEVAHYYWSGNADWVDEGAADLMASVIENAHTGRPVEVTNNPCAHAANIAKLESLAASKGGVEFGCNYSLGERLFVDMLRTLGDERFRQGFRALYLASEIEDDSDDLRGTSVDIEHVREAFRTDDGAESAIIARWYDGTEPYDLSRLDTGPVDPKLAQHQRTYRRGLRHHGC